MQMTTTYAYQDVFTYERLEEPTKENSNGNRVYHNCVLLKDVEGAKKGTRVPHITGQIDLYLWHDDEDFEEVSSTI